MQAAASRPAGVQRHRRSDRINATPSVVAAGDLGLLDALPIAAAIIERTAEGNLRVAAHNSRFVDAVDKSDCTALDWNEAECLKTGPIAGLIQSYFDGTDTSGELDLHQGEGVASTFFRLKLAPLPKTRSSGQRCLLSVVDRTVEVQAERTLRAEMLRDSLTGLPNRLAFSEAIEKAGEKVGRDLEHGPEFQRAAAVRASRVRTIDDHFSELFARYEMLSPRPAAQPAFSPAMTETADLALARSAMLGS